MYRTMEYEINELSHHVDANHIQACTDLEKASQFLTEALLSETQRSSALRRLIHRLEQRAAENGRSLSEQVESNRQLKLQVDELQKQLEDKDNSLTQAKQSISILKNELRELQQQQQQQQQQQSHQSSHRTIQDVTEWLQDGESQTIVANIVKEEESVLQNPGVGIKKEEDAYDGYPCMQIEEDGITTEQTSYSSADIEVELPQVEDEMSDMAPVDSSEMSQSESPDPARSLRSSMQLVKRSTSATQDQQATTSKDHQDGKRPNAGGQSQMPLSTLTKYTAVPETDVGNGRRHKCPICGKGFFRRSTMKRHQEAVHKEEGPSSHHPADEATDIPTDPANAGQEESLSAMSSRTEGPDSDVDDGRTHKCPVCGKAFSRMWSMRRHQEGVHKEFSTLPTFTAIPETEVDNGRTYMCSVLGQGFPTKKTLREQERGFSIKKTLREHEQDSHPNEKISLEPEPPTSAESGEKPHSCERFPQTGDPTQRKNVPTAVKHSRERSGKRPSQAGGRTQGKNISTGTKPYQCDQCGKSFSKAKNLTQHKYIHRVDRPYRCQVCGKGFTVLSILKTHMHIHTGERPHQCQHCGKAFSQAYTLTTHERIHTGERPYRCSICGKGFSQSGNFKTHMQVHAGEKPFSCGQCGKSFLKSTNLIKHQRIHTGEKPYHCTLCSKRFTQQEHLKAHMYTHTGERPYPCKHCGKTFSTLRSASRHQLIHK